MKRECVLNKYGCSEDVFETRFFVANAPQNDEGRETGIFVSNLIQGAKKVNACVCGAGDESGIYRCSKKSREEIRRIAMPAKRLKSSYPSLSGCEQLVGDTCFPGAGINPYRFYRSDCFLKSSHNEVSVAQQGDGVKVQGFRVQVSSFRVQGSSYKLQVTSCRLQVSRRRRVRLWRKSLQLAACNLQLEAGFRVRVTGIQVTGCRLQGFKLQGTGYRDSSYKLQVTGIQVTSCRLQGFKLQVAGYRFQVSRRRRVRLWRESLQPVTCSLKLEAGFPPEAGPPLAGKLATCGLQLEACSLQLEA